MCGHLHPFTMIRLMAENLHHLIGSIFYYTHGFIHPRWLALGFLNHQQYHYVKTVYKDIGSRSLISAACRKGGKEPVVWSGPQLFWCFWLCFTYVLLKKRKMSADVRKKHVFFLFIRICLKHVDNILREL